MPIARRTHVKVNGRRVNIPSYRVREGDTLSTIAARVDGRPANSTWQLATQIFAANPNAFIRANPDLIKLGWEIKIPDAASWNDVAPAAPVRAPSSDGSNGRARKPD